MCKEASSVKPKKSAEDKWGLLQSCLCFSDTTFKTWAMQLGLASNFWWSVAIGLCLISPSVRMGPHILVSQLRKWMQTVSGEPGTSNMKVDAWGATDGRGLVEGKFSVIIMNLWLGGIGGKKRGSTHHLSWVYCIFCLLYKATDFICKTELYFPWGHMQWTIETAWSWLYFRLSCFLSSSSLTSSLHFKCSSESAQCFILGDCSILFLSGVAQRRKLS